METSQIRLGTTLAVQIICDMAFCENSPSASDNMQNAIVADAIKARCKQGSGLLDNVQIKQNLVRLSLVNRIPEGLG